MGRSFYARRGKRGVDLAIVLASSPFAIPVVVIGWLLVRGTSGPPGFFGQTRVGRGLKTFTLWKLRSMRSGHGPTITAGRDPRITPVGAVLRRWKLDELPQLWNILTGSMSIVGPRPEVPEWVDKHPAIFSSVLAERPGLTDLASVVYFTEAEVLANGAVTYGDLLPEKLRLNLLYTTNLSALLDAKIIALTLYSFVAPARAARRGLAIARRLEGRVPQPKDRPGALPAASS